MNRKAIEGMANIAMAAAIVCGPTTGWAEDAAPVVPLATPQVEPQTHVRFDKGRYKPGFERLRVVRRENTSGTVAAQVALGVGISLLTRGVAFGAQSFSKDDLAGSTLDELHNDPAAVNPAMSDLQDALSRVATDIYRQRAAQALEVARKDGSTAEEIEEAGRVPDEADTPLHPGPWHLVYENLTGTDELFRLKFGAELGRPGFMRPPAVCAYESAPMTWSQWQAEHWQLLRDERAKAVARCVEVLGATPAKFW